MRKPKQRKGERLSEYVMRLADWKQAQEKSTGFECKSFYYPKTNARRYFIDGRRVSQAAWYEAETRAQMQGKRYNSSWGKTRKDGVIVGGHSFN